MSSREKPRILISSIGLGGHEIGAITIARALKDAGMEVIYLGLCQTPESIVETAMQEDVDVIGISSLSGIHDEVIPEIIRLLKSNRMEHIVVIVGGIIPKEDIPALELAGVKAVFGPGTPSWRIVDFINSVLRSHPRSSVSTPSK